METEQSRLDGLRRVELFQSASLIFAGICFLIWAFIPDIKCGPLVIGTTSIESLEKPASGLEFLTMEVMPSAATHLPPGSYAKAKASSSLQTLADGPL